MKHKKDLFKTPKPLEYKEHYRPGLGTENVAPFLRSMVQMLRPNRVLEIGAGCGSFTRHYTNSKINKISLTDLDRKNYRNLKIKFKNFKNVKILDQTIYKITKKFDAILYLHVLEHIKKDVSELKEAEKKLNKNGYLVIMVPAHQKLYSNFDKAIGHFRRYERKFFKKKLNNLSRVRLMSLDSSGYILYYLNKFFFSKETYSSNFKIFIWDKIFTPISVIFDLLTLYFLEDLSKAS